MSSADTSRPHLRAGRKQDGDIDRRVLEVANHYLSSGGFSSMSLAMIAKEAGTTRQAIYRRWSSREALANDALALSHVPGRSEVNDDPFQDLVLELQDFQHGVSKPGRLSLVGTMLQDITPDDAKANYQALIIAPRRQRIRSILQRAQGQGLISADADLDIAVTFATGSWYARALAGEAIPDAWPQRTAALLWRSVGGTPPRDV